MKNPKSMKVNLFFVLFLPFYKTVSAKINSTNTSCHTRLVILIKQVKNRRQKNYQEYHINVYSYYIFTPKMLHLHTTQWPEISNDHSILQTVNKTICAKW